MSCCYLCGRILSEHPANAGECQCHNEHIIPNAIGGHLTDRHILCKDCGGSLSKDSDSGFTDIFAPFIVQMQEAGILKPLDRNNNSKRPLGGFIFADKTTDSPKEEIKYNKGKAIPTVPHYYVDEEKKIVNIYAEKKTAGNYIKKIERELRKKGKNLDDYEYKIHNDLMSEGFLGLNFTNGKPNFNKDFESDFLKIAVEMALHFGISRECLTSALYTEIAKVIYEEYRKQGSEFDMYKPLGYIYDYILIRVLLLFMNNDAIKKMIDLNPSSADIAQKVIALEGLSPDDVRSICLQQCTEEYFRKILLEKENKKIVGLSYPNETYKISNKHPEMVREYTMAKFQGYYDEEYADFKPIWFLPTRHISRQDYDDGATTVLGKHIELRQRAELRARYLTPYNFIICAKFSAYNNHTFSRTSESFFRGMLDGSVTNEEFHEYMMKFPKPTY